MQQKAKTQSKLGAHNGGLLCLVVILKRRFDADLKCSQGGLTRDSSSSSPGQRTPILNFKRRCCAATVASVTKEDHIET